MVSFPVVRERPSGRSPPQFGTDPADVSGRMPEDAPDQLIVIEPPGLAAGRHLEQFQEKCAAVFRPELRKNKRLDKKEARTSPGLNA
ncbi:hypothetical protein [Mesorhizobium waimense]|uniref:hypothetical protein n=1 Tax=Mesorhizobium waimense TaxID=1300307 RepID=UPI0011C3C266|nr:hypothetical protein [Mesorhizobium waimense]